MTPALLVLLVVGPVLLGLWARAALVSRCERCGRPAVSCSFPFRCRGRGAPQAPPRVDD